MTGAATRAPLPEEVRTERLVLRTWRAADVEALAAAVTRNLGHLRPWMPWIAEEPLDPGARLQLIDRWEQLRLAGDEVVLGIWQGGRAVGGTGLHRRADPAALEIGYWLDKDHQGRGLATEAASALTGAAFERADTDRVEIVHDQANTRSGAVPARLGYRFDRQLARAAQSPGETGVECRWQVTRQEWAAIHTRRAAAAG